MSDKIRIDPNVPLPPPRKRYQWQRMARTVTIDTLRAASSLLKTHGLCRGSYAVDSSGHPVGSLSSTACRFDLAGSIDHVVEHNQDAFNAAWDLVKTKLGVAQSKAAVLLLDSMTLTDTLRLLAELTGDPLPPAASGSRQSQSEHARLVAELL